MHDFEVFLKNPWVYSARQISYYWSIPLIYLYNLGRTGPPPIALQVPCSDYWDLDFRLWFNLTFKKVLQFSWQAYWFLHCKFCTAWFSPSTSMSSWWSRFRSLLFCPMIQPSWLSARYFLIYRSQLSIYTLQANALMNLLIWAVCPSIQSI